MTGSGTGSLRMEKDLNAAQPANEALGNQSSPGTSFLDTQAQFEVWLDALKPGQETGRGFLYVRPEDLESSFVVECARATDCQITFEGVLYFDGSLAGSIWSDGGKLVTGTGWLDADIEVGTAYINGGVNGNIIATGRVVLNGNAKVIGNIKAQALSIKHGAIFEGDCSLQDGPRDQTEPADNESPEAEIGEYLAAGANG